jgi:hypothetical protein
MPEFPNDLSDNPATFETMTGPKVTVPVHFNPASLQHTVSNTLKEEGQGAKKKQYVSQTTAKLTMDVVFDTTDTGEDVRITTNKMAQLLQPVPEGQSKKVPPLVKFSWGAYSFTGMVEQFKETIDFFAAGGLPLRSSINLTLSSQDVSFEGGTSSDQASVDGDLAAEPVVVPDDEGPLGGPQGAANQAGDPRAARGIAAANGASSLRFGGGGGLAIGASASVGFAAGASVGVGFSAGIGASAGGGLLRLGDGVGWRRRQPAAGCSLRRRWWRRAEHRRWCRVERRGWRRCRRRCRRWAGNRCRSRCPCWHRRWRHRRRRCGGRLICRAAGREQPDFACPFDEQAAAGVGEHFERRQGGRRRASARRRRQRPEGRCQRRRRVCHRRAPVTESEEMPIRIEEMQAEIRPERQEAPADSGVPVAGAAREAEVLPGVLRELALRDERRRRWQAD